MKLPLSRRLVFAAASVAAGAIAAFAWSRSTLIAPEPTLLLLDRNGEFLAEVGTDERGEAGWWEISDPPPRVAAATIAAEDRRLGRHPGVDPIAIARAVKQNVGSGRRVSGASTLAMQIARMQHPGPRGWVRKAREAVTAIALTARHGSDAVLRHYLRIAPYGNRCRGISYASRRYFDKPVEDLTWAEASFLAALPQAPGRMNPLVPEGRIAAEARARRILGVLADDGVISALEHEAAKSQLAELLLPLPGRRANEAMHAVLRVESLLEPEQARLAARPIVRTTLDLALTKRVSWMLAERVDAWERAGAGNAAAIVVDARTMEVRAWVGSTDYFDTERKGSIDYARVPRSPGSTLKPLFYGLALDTGVLTPATVLDDLRLPDGAVGNADGLFLGPLLPRAALGNSRNVPAIEVVERVGLDEAHDFLRRAGLHDGSMEASHFGRGLAIGNQPATLEALVRAYSTFPGDGLLRELRWTADALPAPAPRRMLSEESARRVTQWLSDPLARLPTFPRMGASELPFPAAFKTGTSVGYRDAWTVAFTSRYLVAVWVGHPDWRPMRELGGFGSAAEIAHDVLLLLHDDERDGLADLAFPPPRGSAPVRLCARTGKLAGDACEHVVAEWYGEGAAPHRECDAHLKLAVDRRNGLLATARTPLEHRDVRAFTRLAPRFAAWAAEHGLPAPPEETSPLDARTPSESWTAIAGTVRRNERPVTLRLVSPADGSVVLRDPEMPEEMSTLPLQVVVDGAATQVVWYVDGKPWTVVDVPSVARWPLRPGEHTFQARLPYRPETSATIRVTVR